MFVLGGLCPWQISNTGGCWKRKPEWAGSLFTEFRVKFGNSSSTIYFGYCLSTRRHACVTSLDCMSAYLAMCDHETFQKTSAYCVPECLRFYWKYLEFICTWAINSHRVNILFWVATIHLCASDLWIQWICIISAKHDRHGEQVSITHSLPSQAHSTRTLLS